MNAITNLRVPPDPVLASEAALLGAVLCQNGRYWECARLGLQPEHFASDLHQALWREIGLLLGSGMAVDPRILAVKFSEHAELRQRDPLLFMAQLATSSAGIASIGDYARMVLDAALRRRAFRLGSELCAVAVDRRSDFAAALAEAQAELDQCRPAARQAAMVPLIEAVHEAQAAVVRAVERGGVDGVPFGLSALDALIGGAVKSDLVVLAGRPGMGKTALAWQVALTNARAGRRVAFFTLEMPAAQLAGRAIAQVAQVGAHLMRRGDLDAMQQAAVAAADAELDLPLYLNRSAVPDTGLVRLRVHELLRHGGVDLVLVDYMQLLDSDEQAENQVQKLARISRALKLMALELNVPVIALSQLNRGVEGRDDKRPLLADLRDSGAIEQDADTVIFVYREEHYVARQEPRQQDGDAHPQWRRRLQLCAGQADLIVAKNRHGPCAAVTVGFEPTLIRFHDLGTSPR